MLIGGLERLHLPIAPAERETLIALLRYLKEPETRLDTIKVTAEDQPTSPRADGDS